LEELRLGHELGSKNPRWSYPSAQWVRYCEHLLELDGRLHDFLAGKAKPANVGERIKLARICAFKQWNRAALRFYEEAFAARPTLRVAHRYDSACAAALAGCGQGKDADKLDDKERVRLRRQALDWLYADLEAWDRLLDKQPGRSAANVATGLQHWLVDPALRGVRGPEALAKLSAEEQEEWDCLWTEVAEQAARPVQAARDAAWRNPPAADPPTTPAALAVRIEAQLDLAGPTVAGGNFDLKQLRGKVVLIDFWASWCGPCVAEMPNVKRVYDRYHKYGFEVVGVSLDNKKETLLQFLKAKQVPWPQLFFADKDAQGWNNPLARKCGIHGIPYTILVDPAGKVFRLGLRGATLEPAVAKLLGKGPDSLADMPRLAQGRYYVRLGLGAKASGSYAKIFAAEPKDAAGWRTRSEHFLRLGLWDLAARDLAAAFKLEAPTTYRQCLSHALTNVYTDDTASYRQLCSLIPKRFQQDAGDAYGASEMVRACIVAGSPVADLGWAVRMGEKCVAKGSARWWCHADLGLAYYRAGAYERAVEQLERARQIDPIAEISTDPVLAMAYYRLGRTKEAHEALSRATRLADQVSESIAFSTLGSMPLGWWAWLCHVLLYREARTLIDGSPPPDNPLWETARARAFAALGEQKKAETACAKALSQAPKSLAVRLACARLHAELAQWDKAGADLAGDIEADPDKKRLTQFYFLRAMVNGRLDRFAEAVADFTQTRKPAADSPLVPNNLAWLLATCPQPKFRDPRRAVELAKKAVELAPREGGYWNTLGVAHYRAGDWKSAIDALNKSMERNRGGNAFDWLFLAMAQQKLGKAPEARQWYDKATAWVEKSRASALDPVQSEELRRFQREAQEVLEQKSKQ
ncbi:MAG: redoxin family protein, partial [Gemmataceae bacterium]